MTLRIYGAGLSGLLTATMLRRMRPFVMEAQEALPDNHGALLRFRTDAVADETNQDFREVSVLKAIKRGRSLDTTSTLRDANQYSRKVLGRVIPRSVLDLAPCVRYIAPDNFIEMMARDAILKMNAPLTKEALDTKDPEDAVISTIPMPALMSLVGWPTPPAFEFREVWSVVATIIEPLVDVYQTVYYPEWGQPFYRASITGARLIVEYAEDPTKSGADPLTDTQGVLGDFGLSVGTVCGLHTVKHQKYGKLVPLPAAVREEFLLAMTDQYNLYSVGRFATWRQILLDDVVKDVRKVATWITQRNAYQRRLETGR
jgi:hypothetical protein